MSSSVFKIAIVGGGSAGIDIAARLARRLPSGSITLFEPSATHYYQPLFTLVGGGIVPLSKSWRSTASLIPAGVHWIKEAVTELRPEANEFVTTHGRFVYDFLVVTPGIHIDWDAIPGLSEALANGVACSNYSAEHVEKTWQQIRHFKGGTALFTHPRTPIKCGGAPQKIMYLAEHAFRRMNMRERATVIFATAGDKMFAVQKYREALDAIVLQRDIAVRFKHNLVAIDPKKRLATFEVLDDGSYVEISFDLLHVTPPMRAPDLVSKSTLASDDGWVDLDAKTLRHVRFANVFSAGDASNLPTSKTGAAVRKQAPVVVENLLAVMGGKPPTASYDGYTSCPIITGYGRVIMAEFDYDLEPRETFPFDQGKERLSMYLFKKELLPRIYWYGMMRGRA